MSQNGDSQDALRRSTSARTARGQRLNKYKQWAQKDQPKNDNASQANGNNNYASTPSSLVNNLPTAAPSSLLLPPNSAVQQQQPISQQQQLQPQQVSQQQQANNGKSGFITQVKQKKVVNSKQILLANDKANTSLEDVEMDEQDQYEFEYEQLLTWEYDADEFDPFKFMAHLPPHNDIKCDRPINIPKKPDNREMTLVLDLDETLVHCSSEVMKGADFVFPVRFRGVIYQVYVRKRPHFEEFLKRCSQLFEVIVFTASEKAYADRLLNIIDPNGQYIHGRAFRDSCVFVEGNYLKDLTVLNRDLSKTIIVDNSPQAYGYHIDNGIPIVSWFDDEKDEELLKLIPFLTKLSKANDVRPHIREKFRLNKVLEKYKKPQPSQLQ